MSIRHLLPSRLLALASALPIRCLLLLLLSTRSTRESALQWGSEAHAEQLDTAILGAAGQTQRTLARMTEARTQHLIAMSA